MNLVEETIAAIRPLDEAAMRAARRAVDYCLKPPGSLGRLEDMVCQIAGITGRVSNRIHKKAIVVMMADNGVAAEGVAMYPRDVTRIGADFVTSGRMGVNFLARHAGADIIAVDIGIAGDIDCPKALPRKIRHGTGNFLRGPAMSRDEALRAVATGIEVACAAVDRGYDLIGTGEIGIGNTTAAAAMLHAFSGAPVDQVVGRGAGLDDAALARKKELVRRACALHRPDPDDAIDVLAKVGGLDIGGLVGVYLACAARRVPVAADGFISTVAALAAIRLAPAARDFMLASHLSAEPGARLLAELTGLAPVLHMDMRLGEGTGCALLFPIVEAALRMPEEMGTFAALGKTPDDIAAPARAYLGEFGRGRKE